PAAGEGEPDGARPRLQDRPAVRADRRLEVERVRDRDDHVLALEHDPLVEDLLVGGEPEIVDAYPAGAAHPPAEERRCTGSTKTSMTPPHTAGLHDIRSSVRSTRTRSGTPVSSTRWA